MASLMLRTGRYRNTSRSHAPWFLRVLTAFGSISDVVGRIARIAAYSRSKCVDSLSHCAQLRDDDVIYLNWVQSESKGVTIHYCLEKQWPSHRLRQ